MKCERCDSSCLTCSVPNNYNNCLTCDNSSESHTILQLLDDSNLTQGGVC